MDLIKYFNGIIAGIIAGTHLDWSPSQFVAGPSPRGGWPIRPHSRSKYRPMNEVVGCKAAQRRRKQIVRNRYN